MINNPKEEYFYTANSKEQHYVSKCFDEFTMLTEQEARNLKLIKEFFETQTADIKPAI